MYDITHFLFIWVNLTSSLFWKASSATFGTPAQSRKEPSCRSYSITLRAEEHSKAHTAFQLSASETVTSLRQGYSLSYPTPLRPVEGLEHSQSLINVPAPKISYSQSHPIMEWAALEGSESASCLQGNVTGGWVTTWQGGYKSFPVLCRRLD